ncbi:hypothetical protein QZH41_017404, partial [Actinostola sp. cb2023]
MMTFWRERKIDMFKDGVSVPGLTMKYLFSSLPRHTYFALFEEKNKDLYHTFKENNTGGPSIIFHRYHEAGKTKIREVEMSAKGEEAKECKKILGYDANALYLWAIMQEMPTGSYTRRRVETNFKPESSRRMADEWWAWEENERNIHIRQLNNTEKRIGDRRLPVDGFHSESRTVFQFHGCYWHGHQCELNRGKEMNATRKKPMSELRAETDANTQYIRSQGYQVIEMRECDWKRMKQTIPLLQSFLDSEFSRPLDRCWTLTQEQILQAVINNTIFGVVECDIRNPETLREKFNEMCPIFKNTEISRDDIGEYMRKFAEENDIMPRPRRSLIGSLKGEKILLATPLLKWYLEHGLIVTKIYQVVEYTPETCFESFGEAVSNARRAGDVDPSKAIIADTMKLVGNSSYGKTITNQLKHHNVKFCSDTEVSALINTPFFRQLDSIDEDTYEVQSAKKRINLNLPIQVGYFVYQYAKLRMLQFYYDFLDNAYIAISAESFEEIIRPEIREEFEAEKHDWLPRTDTAEHRAFDKRTPGLFKIEFE